MNRIASNLIRQGFLSKENSKPTVILLSVPIILTTFNYFGTKTFYLNHLASAFILFENSDLSSVLYTFLASFVLLGCIPALIIKFIFRDPLSAYGVRMGDIRWGIKGFLLLAPVIIGLAYLSSRTEPFRFEYPLYKGASRSLSMFSVHAFSYLVFYLGWEFFFRGYMQSGLEGAFGGWNAILAQTLASCLLHSGKPLGEIYASILGGVVLGIIAWRSRSLLFVILLHWLLGASLDVFVSYF